ncbi:MAG: hypothetical protein JWO09_2562 [Bacteroidetes bacterium]|nr:hypothetical protein [Bacteroidota bacterium]
MLFIKNRCLAIVILFLTSFSAIAQTPYYKWALSFSSTYYTSSTAVKVNNSNDVFVAGWIGSPVDFDPTPSSVMITPTGMDGFLAKYDQNKNLLWADGFITSPAGNVNINSIFLDGNSFVYVVGDFSSNMDADPGSGTFNLTATAGGNPDVFIIKLNQAGQFIWAKSFGGTNTDKATDLCKDAAGNLYLTGTFQGTIDSNPGAGVASLTSAGVDDMFVLKIDASGNYVWSFALGGNSYDNSMRIFTVGSQVLLFGTFVNTVDFNPGSGVNNMTTAGSTGAFFAKYTLSGTYINATKIEALSGNFSLLDICMSPGNSIYIAGQYAGSFDADPSAGTATLSSTPEPQGYICKYDTAFSYQWGISTASAPFSSASCNFLGVEADSSGNVYAAGTIRVTVDLDPGPGTYNLTASANEAGVVCRYNSSGALTGAFKLDCTISSSSNYQNAFRIAADKSQNFYVIGTLWGNVDFDPSAATSSILTPSYYSNGYLAKYGNCMSLTSSVNATICHGQTYNLGGQNLGETGTYMHTFHTAMGCDSIVTLNLTVKHVNTEVTVSTTSIKSLASAPAAFQWINCTSGTSVAGATTATFLPADNDYYAVAVTQNGCTDTSACENIFSTANSGAPDIAWGSVTNNSSWGRGRFLKTDQYGNFYVTGGFAGTMDVDLQAGTHTLTSAGSSVDLFLTKYDNNGLWQWSFPIGSAGTTGNTEEGYSVYIDGQENVYLTGTFQGTSDFDPGPGVMNLTAHGPGDAFFAKYNSNGELIWAKGFGSTSADTYPVSIVLDKNSNVLLSGVFSATMDFDPNAGVYNVSPAAASGSTQLNSGYVAKYDNAGNFISAYALASCDNGAGDGPALTVDRSNNIIVSGTFDGTSDFDVLAGTYNVSSSATGASDVYVAKYSPTMALLWIRKFGDSGGDQAFSLTSDADNNIYLMGQANGNVDFSGGAGTAVYFNPATFIVRYDSAGIFQLKYPLTATGVTTVVHCLELDAAKNLYAAGSYFFNLNCGAGSIASLGQHDGFVVKYDRTGALQWNFSIASADDDEVTGVTADREGNVFVAGIFANTVDFDPTASAYPMTSPSGSRSFIAKYGQDCGAISTSFSNSGGTVTAAESGSYYTWIDCSTNQVVYSSSSASFSPSASGNYKAIIQQGTCVDSTACTFVVSSGISEPEEVKLVLYPNPAGSFLYLSFGNNIPVKLQAIRCVDVAGKSSQVTVIEQKDNRAAISLEGLSEGLYFVELMTEDGQIYHSKFIKLGE